MARAPILQLADISLSFGGDPVFSGLNLTIQPGDRLALVGRNGSGKSTLMKLLAGEIEPDAGSRVPGAGVRVGRMEQDPDMSGFATLGEFATATLPAGESWKVERVAEGLKFDLDAAITTASGGERRRAALARTMAEDAELLLLDEPTNHLDIEAILWLEEHLRESRAALVLISHDRAFQRALARSTLWLDRGVLRRQDRGFDHFEAWRDKVWEEEDLERHKLDRLIKAEARWAVEGISARRKRNMGRVRALADLRAERAAQIRRQGSAALALESDAKSGKKVIEAEGLSKSFGDRRIIRDFAIRVGRGDRVALVGPNGIGKSTLVKILIGQEAPDSGQVRHGSNLEVAVLDQNRETLMPERSLWENLTMDPEMAVSGKSDQVMVRGRPRHVVSYLKDFLFTDEQVRTPVRALSGGERARVLLARLMARPSNLLVLDEPTNDLDVETLDLLQEVLSDYEGTVLLVSHDRDFIDRIATTTLAFEGGGRITAYAGGWSDMLAQRGAPLEAETPGDAPIRKEKQKPAKVREKTALSGLTFTQRHRLEELPGKIDRLSGEVAKLTDLLAEPDLYARDKKKFDRASAALAERQARLEAAEAEWLELAEKAEQES